jgi:hypothetical protein
MPGREPFAARREAQLDTLGDLIAEHVDRDALLRLIEDGTPSISSQPVGQTSESPHAGEPQEEAEPLREPTAASAQRVRSVAEKKLKADGR